MKKTYLSLLEQMKKNKARFSHPDSQPLEVEPCASTETDEESCGIAVLDTDGEWIEMKSKKQVPFKLSLSNAIKRQR